jgi:hypothetical protein
MNPVGAGRSFRSPLQLLARVVSRVSYIQPHPQCVGCGVLQPTWGELSPVGNEFTLHVSFTTRRADNRQRTADTTIEHGHQCHTSSTSPRSSEFSHGSSPSCARTPSSSCLGPLCALSPPPFHTPCSPSPFAHASRPNERHELAAAAWEAHFDSVADDAEPALAVGGRAIALDGLPCDHARVERHAHRPHCSSAGEG